MTKNFPIGLAATLVLGNSSIDAAQNLGTIPRIGFLTGQNTPTSTSSDSNVEASVKVYDNSVTSRGEYQHFYNCSENLIAI